MKKISILIALFFALNIFAQRPNVILVLTDDQGIGDLGCYGNEIVKTPNIDKFSTESLNLMNFHVERACAPSRAALMTGRYCNSTGLWYTITQRAIVRENETTIAQALKKNGYTTGMFGKWHLGDMKPYRPQDKGFDRVVMHGSGGIGQTSDYWDNTYFDDTYFVDGKPQKFKGYCTDVFTAESIKFIESAVKAKKPFFCYLATNAPHGPYKVGKEYEDMYKEYKLPGSRTAFYGMITNIDDNFKILMDKVDELGIRDNTIVIYMTDNGTANGSSPSKKGATGNQAVEGFNLGMKGKKASPYDGGHRVPCIIRYPNGGLKTEKKIDVLTAHFDIMPTILEWCGAKYDGKLPLAGKSMLNLINKNDDKGFAGRIIVTDSHISRIPPKWTMSAVMQDKWRLVAGKELYDVSKDVGQEKNIADQYPEKLKELRDFYDKWYDNMYQGENLEVNPIFVYKNEINLLDSHYMQPFNDKYSAWNQSMVKSGSVNTGTWDIEVLEDGEYTFELRRFPREFDKPITYGEKKNPKALPINYANLTIDKKQVGESSVDDKQHYVHFKVKLKKGRHVVESLFKGGKLEVSPYYIYIF